MSGGVPDTARYARVKALFLDALDQPSTARATWLAAACDDPALRDEVATLLAAHDDAEGSGRLDRPLFDRPTADPADARDYWAGRMVGPWRLAERLGAGGMGTVYRAERADGTYERTVAVKLLRPGNDIEALAGRLRAERRLLARLEHPLIARLYDGGVTEDGLPYLAMELVHGEPVTAYAEARGLGVEARLRLFRQVCEAVAYAHRALVVHRDLKPSNVLVTEEDGRPNVKLLDFGIAKLLDARGEDTSRDFTPTTAALTPAYAAPEQVRGRPATTATDVYSLGVLLYELLVGQRPYDLAGQSPAEVERLVCEAEPERPSVAAASPRLRGDLDTIVMKALAKEPDRRYPTADALSEDLRRYLDGLPVRARPATAGYRMGKFVRRHRVSVAAAGTVLLALVGGLGTALWQAHEAHEAAALAGRRFDTAREAARALIFDVHDAVETLPGSTPVREVIVSRALDYLDRLTLEAGDDATLRLDLAQAYLRVGNVQGNPNNSNLGRLQDALTSYRRGLALLPARTPVDSLGLAVTHLRAVLLEKLGDVYAHLGRPDSALAHFDRARALFRQNAEADPDNPDRLVALAIGHLKRGDYTGNPNFPNAGRPAEALPYYRTTLDLLYRVRRRDTTDVQATRLIGVGYERLGSIYSLEGDFARAREAYRESKDIRDRLHAAFPNDAELHRDAAVAHEKLGLTYQAEGRLEEARSELEAAYAGYLALAKVDPRDVNAQVTLAVNEMQRGALMASPDLPSFGDRTAARALYRRALDRLRAVTALDSTNARVQALMAEAEAALAR